MKKLLKTVQNQEKEVVCDAKQKSSSYTWKGENQETFGKESPQNYGIASMINSPFKMPIVLYHHSMPSRFVPKKKNCAMVRTKLLYASKC